MINQITIIGTGRVAGHLAERLNVLGLGLFQILGRNPQNTQKIASQLQNCDAISDYSKLKKTNDLFIIAVSDDNIVEVAQKLAENLPKNAFVVHTSGSVSSGVLGDYFENYGVLYPLQTFSKNEQNDWLATPICICSNNEKTTEKLAVFAEKLAPKVFFIDDKQRASLHVAAVFVNNFSNHLFAIAQNICEQENISFDILRPLIATTAQKIQTNSPTTVQTGPAARGDKKTIERHLNYLNDSNNPDLAELYELISRMIFSRR